MRPIHSALLAASLATTPSLALAAEGPVPSGTLALSAERLTGFFKASEEPEDGGDTDSTEFGLMVGGRVQPYSLPRLGFDGFVIDGLSIGGTLGIYTGSVEDTDATSFLVSPRVGYATYFSDSVGIWPRGGFSFYSLKLSNDNADGDATTRYFAFDVEAPFLFNLADWLAIHAGPTIDVSLTGTTEVDTPVGNREVDMSLFAFGLAAGITGFIP